MKSFKDSTQSPSMFSVQLPLRSSFLEVAMFLKLPGRTSKGRVTYRPCSLPSDFFSHDLVNADSVSRNPGQIHLPLTLGLLVVSPGSSGGKQQRWGLCPVHVVGSQQSECPGWCTPGILVLVSGAHSSMSQPLAVSSHLCSSVMNCQEQPSSSRR